MTHSLRIPPIKNWQNFWEASFLPVIVPMTIAFILGPLLAYFITADNLLMALVLAFLIPGLILFNKYPFVAIIIWMSLIPFLPYGRVSPPIYWMLHRALIPLALGITILWAILRIKKFRAHLGPAELATIVYVLIVTISILLTSRNPTLTTYQFFDRYFIGLTAYWLVRLFGPREKDLKHLVPFMFVLCLAESIIGLLSWFAPETLPEIWIFSQQGARTTGTLGNPAAYTATLMFVMLFLLHYALNQKNKFVAGILFAAFGLGLTCIFFSFSRGSWLAGGLVLVGLLLIYPKPILSILGLVLPIMLVLSTTVLAGEVSYAYERLNTEETLNNRRVLAYAGEQMFLAKPFFGWGYDRYDDHDWKFMKPVGDAAPTKWDIEKGTSHNTYMTILAEIGVVGFFFQFFPVLWWLCLSIKVWPRMPVEGYWSQKLLVIMWLSIGFQCVVSQFMDMRYFLFPLTMIWIVLGLIGNMVQSYLSPNSISLK
jgi:O-antigen ligase